MREKQSVTDILKEADIKKIIFVYNQVVKINYEILLADINYFVFLVHCPLKLFDNFSFFSWLV